jgi:hypothetical protein
MSDSSQNQPARAIFPTSEFVERFRARYPLLAMLIEEKGMEYESFFSMRKTERLLGVSTRTLQRRIKRGELKARGIGRGRFHAEDLEYLIREGRPRRGNCDLDHLDAKHSDI